MASADNLVDAWEQAYATDRQAPFGGIIVVNQTLGADLAAIISQIFCEVIIAPEFTAEAREIFAAKKNLRLMTAKGSLPADSLREIRSVVGGVLLQDRDSMPDRSSVWEVVSKRQPTEEEMRAMVFGWNVVKHVKSNAIVYAGCEHTIGIGAGQMSRVDSSKIAVWKAGEAGAFSGWIGGVFGCVFPVSGWLDCGCRCGCQGGDSSSVARCVMKL